jgi:hypothetical protein
VRGQTNLFALVLALVLLTAATVVGVTLADAALAGADRDPTERRAATTTAQRLTAADSPMTVRANVLNASRVAALNASRLHELAPPTRAGAVRVALDERTVVDRGSPGGGWTVSRAVLVRSQAESTTTRANLSRRSTVTVPRGVDRATVAVAPGPNTTVRSVRANDRVLLHDGGGLNTTATVHLDRYEPSTLRIDAGANATGRVAVTYHPRIVDDRTLTVTVDA